MCKGFRDEKTCLPCLEEACIAKHNAQVLEKTEQLLDGQTAEDFCSICWSTALGQAASVRLNCRHIFHVDCLLKILKTRWQSPRIVFGFSNCPQCKSLKIAAPQCPAICQQTSEINKFEQEVMEKSL
jgi:E3 ubiquitin-protein ligase MYCBP2